MDVIGKKPTKSLNNVWVLHSMEEQLTFSDINNIIVLAKWLNLKHATVYLVCKVEYHIF